ncbi:MAG TPA: UDP-N-acetylmuramoyl-L-alanine--D-glutamate ligase [Bacteroidales bacterium]|nr:UDP-N-acetylmuramoyl-L-alanine--D-glutamate ligase [Bacteroidales bacterium]
MTEAIIRKLRNQRILILGFGREGQSTLEFIRRNNIQCQVCIADQRAPEPQLIKALNDNAIEANFGPDYLDWAREFDLIIKSPGIPSRLVPLNLHERISSQTDLFLEAFGRQTIGITGTKGKSTTSSLIHHMLINAGKHSLLTGNIGIPCFDIIPEIDDDSIVVFELSAHQLEFIHHSPHIGLLLNIFPEHLDHFGKLEHYAAAKCNIFAFMQNDDLLIIHSSLSRKIPAHFKANCNFYDASPISIPTMRLRGQHFSMLANAAIQAAMALGIDQQVALHALTTFQPLPHRLEPIGPIDGVLFINDSIATIPQATLAALDAWPATNFLILGGFDRGIDYALIVEGLMRWETPYVLLTGQAGRRMGEAIEAALPGKNLCYFNQLEEAFSFISVLACEGDIVLLSPAAASYDQYKNFEHRGDRFKELALSFRRKNPEKNSSGVVD